MTTFQLSNQFASKAIIHPEYEPEASVFESPHGTYLEGLRAHPGGTGSKFMNPLDQMGFIKPSNDEVTNDLQTSWKGSWDKFSIQRHPVITDASGTFVSTSQETLVPWTCPDYSNWDAICDVGTAIKQTSVADALANYHPEIFSEVEIHFVQSVDNDHDPAAQLRSDKRFAEVPVDLFQGLDAGGMNYAEAVGLDSWQGSIDKMPALLNPNKCLN